ncbi:MAG: AAA family ATPase [Pseudomonadales bacterium]|nr:AAA family ATPase [Pseudomonadales bacterium]
MIKQGNSPVILMPDDGMVSLQTFLDSLPHHCLTLKLFFSVALQLSQALGVIHQRNIIHKDLHAGNVLIHPLYHEIKVTDFGLSTQLPREQPPLKPPEQIEGLLPYISPEQTGRMNRAVDYRTDYYSLGVVFYLVLTGRLPFEADDAIGMVHAHIARRAKPVSEVNPTVPLMVSRIVDKLMAKNAEDRYQSTEGLIHDLTRCQQEWQSALEDCEFELGEHDVSDRFSIPQKLYGREHEIEALWAAFDQACQGHPVLFSLAGSPGVGKSALVREVHKPIAENSALFISGKFDQLQQNTPYSALSSALLEWVQQTLTLKEDAFTRLKHRLLNTLGVNARLLIDFLPDMALILGDLPAVPVLGSEEARNRFHHTVVSLLQVVSESKPVVIFMDDLQWADFGTLQLLHRLVLSAQGNILILIAYRDKEVGLSHPLTEVLDSLTRDVPNAVYTLHLQSLRYDSLNALLSETLHTENGVSELATLVQQKTAGNPFFVIEFLKSLLSEDLLQFDRGARGWSWILEEIEARGITDNVVELMLDKMASLPIETQTVLQNAACIGSRFDVQMLAMISDMELHQLMLTLWPALQIGLLVQEGGDWLPGLVSVPAGGETGESYCSSALPRCRFLHDRMLQAAYSSTDRQVRFATHLLIGRISLEKNPEPIGTALFELVEQFNAGRVLISDQAERLQVAQLNYRAAIVAKNSGVWRTALQYAQVALSLLPVGAWKSHYSDFKSISMLFVECAYLNGNGTVGLAFSRYVLEKLTDDYDKARLCALDLLHGGKDLNIDVAIENGLEGMRYCDLQVPEQEVDLLRAITHHEHQLDQMLANQDEVSQLRFDAIIDADQELRLALVSVMSSCCYIGGRPILARFVMEYSMGLLLEYGGGKQAPTILARYALARICGNKSLAITSTIAAKALQLLDVSPGHPEMANASITIGSMVWFYSHPFSESIAILDKGFREGLANGSVVLALGCHSNSVIYAYSRGEPLERVRKRLDILRDLKRQYGLPMCAGVQYDRMLDLLLGLNTVNLFDADTFADHEWELIQNTSVRAFVAHLEVQWLFWSGQYTEAYQKIPQAEAFLELIPGFIPNVDHLFYKGLLICALWRTGELGGRAEVDQQLEWILEQFSDWVEGCPENFQHKLRLLAAEKARTFHPDLSMLARYREAISLAEANGFLQDAALACELYGECAEAHELPDTAWSTLRQAYYLYGQWGAVVRQTALAQRYPELFAEQDVVQNTPSSAWAESRSASARNLDVDTIVKSSQTISSEIESERLLTQIMAIILESAGAQSGTLLLMRQERLVSVLQTQCDLTEGGLKTEFHLPPIPLEDWTALPLDMVRLVLRSESFSLSQDVANDAQWVADPYFQHAQPKSALCIPIHYQDKISGVLYLENTLATNAFTSGRLHVLEMLLTQVAISLENAKLFEEVKTLNQNLEDKVKERTAELVAVNKELEAFSYSVSHDLRAPLRSIKGFAQALAEDYSSILDSFGLDMLNRIGTNAERMNDLIHGLLELSRLTRSQLVRTEVNLSELAEMICQGLRQQFPGQAVELTIANGLTVRGDRRMLTSVLENLLNNAWKYSSKKTSSSIEFGSLQESGQTIYFVKDNGAGFNMKYKQKLFDSFQRLHTPSEFEGTGIGLATVQRIIQRHEGQIWAESEEGKGATFYFTLNGGAGSSKG